MSRFPAVCIRTSTERPEALDKGCFVIGGIKEESILQAVEIAVDMEPCETEVPDYADHRLLKRLIQKHQKINQAFSDHSRSS